jgi:hypothetical protein
VAINLLPVVHKAMINKEKLFSFADVPMLAQRLLLSLQQLFFKASSERAEQQKQDEVQASGRNSLVGLRRIRCKRP